MISYLFQGLRREFWMRYIRLHCTYYRLLNAGLRKKISVILGFDETYVGLEEEDQAEQALPGFERCRKGGWYKYMLGRYLYAVKFIRQKKVLDCASGFGWGSYLICDHPQSLLSVDINEKALAFAAATWASNRLSFLRHSVLELDSLRQTFDVILAYELIEHLPLASGQAFVGCAARTLNDGGLLILSSAFPSRPAKARRLEKANIYHLHIYTRTEIRQLLSENGLQVIRFFGDFMVTARKR